MGLFDIFENQGKARDQQFLQNEYDGGSEEHKAKLSHELIASAASYEAAKAYEDHCARNGNPGSHAQAVEIFSAMAGAIIDREFETKGLDFIDREQAKRHARQQGEQALAQEYSY